MALRPNGPTSTPDKRGNPTGNRTPWADAISAGGRRSGLNMGRARIAAIHSLV
jgi:hypothetical protein